MAEKHTLDADQPDSKRPRLESAKQAQSRQSQTDQELAVGITAFVSPDTPNIACLVKQRFTDFLVNEISLNGEVVHLRSSKHDRRQDTSEQVQRNKNRAERAKKNASQDSNPANNDSTPGDSATTDSATVDSAKANAATNGDAEEVNQAATPNSNLGSTTAEASPPAAKIEPQISDSDLEKWRKTFGEETASAILDLWSHVLNNPHLTSVHDHPSVLTCVFPDHWASDLAARHVWLTTDKLLAPNYEPPDVDVTGPLRLLIQSKPPTRALPKKKDGSAMASWDELGGDYLHFTLYKEGKDTMEILSYLASRLKIPANKFEFPGTKDRRAVTVQRVAVYRVHANKLAAANKDARGFVLSDFEYKKHGLGLGDLAGNEFHITLRECRLEVGCNSTAEVTRAVTDAFNSLRRNGFINYYGLQRFGSFSVGTHDVGRKILQGDLKGAIDLILAYDPALLAEKSQEGEESAVSQEEVARARGIKYFREEHFPPNDLPRRFTAEKAIMQFLGKKDNRTGHFRQAQDWQGALGSVQRNLRLMYVHAYQSLVWNIAAARRWEVFGNVVQEGDLVIIGEKDQAGKTFLDDVDENGRPVLHPNGATQLKGSAEGFTRARALSKEEAEGGMYDIFDIVLPLPGWDVIYPKNEIGKFYVEFMGSESGGGLDPYKMRRNIKEYSLSGGYRKVMARPMKVGEPKVLYYNNELDQLIPTDMDIARGLKAEDLVLEGKDDRLISVGGDDDDKPNRKVAVVVKMQLASSQYATMALRELTNGGAINFVPQFSGGH